MVNAYSFSKLKFLLVALIACSALSSCGVRGRPQPPTTPPEIGRGQPTFRRATEPFAFSNVPPVPTPAPRVDATGRDASKAK